MDYIKSRTTEHMYMYIRIIFNRVMTLVLNYTRNETIEGGQFLPNEYSYNLFCLKLFKILF